MTDYDAHFALVLDRLDPAHPLNAATPPPQRGRRRVRGERSYFFSSDRSTYCMMPPLR